MARHSPTFSVVLAAVIAASSILIAAEQRDEQRSGASVNENSTEPPAQQGAQQQNQTPIPYEQYERDIRAIADELKAIRAEVAKANQNHPAEKYEWWDKWLKADAPPVWSNWILAIIAFAAGWVAYNAFTHEREAVQIANGLPVSTKIGRLRFEDAAADLETDYSINNRHTLEHVKRHVKRLTKYFGGRRMTDISGAEVRAYISQRQESGARNTTINRELAALRRMFTLAVDAGKLLARPKIRMLQEDNARQGFFEVEQFQAVLRHLPAPLQTVATFAYFTGWRRSEILGLEWSRVDRKAGIVRLDVGTTKNKDGREFIYRDIADVKRVIDQQWEKHEALKRERESRGSDSDRREKVATICPLVFHRKGKRIKSYRKAWQKACESAGCPGRLMHDFQRTAVRNLERAGVSRSVATAITGHKTEAVYRRYAIVSSGDLADAARKLQAMTGTITGTIGLAVDNTENAKASA